jgi:hypothetical protein
MFVDGLWASGMTLHIHRDGMPIPKEMQDSYIKLELTPVQMNAIAAILGLGYRDGELLCYRDEDVSNNILRDDGFGIRADYHAITCEEKRTRTAHRVSRSFASSSAAQSIAVTKDSDGCFDFVTTDDGNTSDEYDEFDYLALPSSAEDCADEPADAFVKADDSLMKFIGEQEKGDS